MKAHLFPCQGFQKVGMGRGLFEAFPALVEQTDDAIGCSLATLCLEDPDGRLGRTEYAQVALYAVSALSWLARGRDAAPDYLAGHSVGEYAALFAAGCFDYATGLTLLRERGRLTGAVGGGMAGIFGLDPKRIEAIVAEALPGVEMASYNAPSMTVIAGPTEKLEAARAHFEAAGCEHYMLLSVSGAFHSSMLVGARDAYARFLADFELKPPTLPLMSSVTGRPYAGGDVASTLIEQFTRPVRWTTVIGALLDLGVRDFTVMGPGGDIFDGWIDERRAQWTAEAAR